MAFNPEDWASPLENQKPEFKLPYSGSSLARMDLGVADAFQSMAQEYYESTGNPLKITDAFRTRGTQTEAYRTKPNLAAKPGHSLHERGMALDIDPAQAEELAWTGLLDKHGFRRPMLGGAGNKNEPWHLEYNDIERRAEKTAATVSSKQFNPDDFMPPTLGVGGFDPSAFAPPPGKTQPSPTEITPEKVMAGAPEAAIAKEKLPDVRKFGPWSREAIMNTITRWAGAYDPASAMTGAGVMPEPESPVWQAPGPTPGEDKGFLDYWKRTRQSRMETAAKALEPLLMPEGKVPAEGFEELTLKGLVQAAPVLVELMGYAPYAAPAAGAGLVGTVVGAAVPFAMLGATEEEPVKGALKGAALGGSLGLMHKLAGGLKEPVAQWTARLAGGAGIGGGAAAIEGGTPEDIAQGAMLFAMFEAFGMPRRQLKDMGLKVEEITAVEKAVETRKVSPEAVQAVRGIVARYGPTGEPIAKGGIEAVQERILSGEQLEDALMRGTLEYPRQVPDIKIPKRFPKDMKESIKETITEMLKPTIEIISDYESFIPKTQRPVVLQHKLAQIYALMPNIGETQAQGIARSPELYEQLMRLKRSAGDRATQLAQLREEYPGISDSHAELVLDERGFGPGPSGRKPEPTPTPEPPLKPLEPSVAAREGEVGVTARGKIAVPDTPQEPAEWEARGKELTDRLALVERMLTPGKFKPPKKELPGWQREKDNILQELYSIGKLPEGHITDEFGNVQPPPRPAEAPAKAAKEPWDSTQLIGIEGKIVPIQNMTIEEFKSNPPPGFQLKKLAKEDIARAETDGTISLDPDNFFGHSAKDRVDIIAHERGHFLEGMISPEYKAKLFDNPTVMNYRGRNINEKLANMIQDRTLPPEVLADYPDLAGKAPTEAKVSELQKIKDKFREATGKQEEIIKPYMGMEIISAGEKFQLVGVNDSGTLYWSKPGQKKQWTIGGYKASDLPDLAAKGKGEGAPSEWTVTVRENITVGGRKTPEPVERNLSVQAKSKKEAIAAVRASGVKADTIISAEPTPTTKMYGGGPDVETIVNAGKFAYDYATRKTPGLDILRSVKRGIQSLVLPTAKSPEHLKAAETLGAELGTMFRRGATAEKIIKGHRRTFDKMGIFNIDIPLEQNPGIKFASDVMQGRKMEPKLQKMADDTRRLFDQGLKDLESAGVPLEQPRENYFPNIVTKESRRAVNQSIREVVKEKGWGEEEIPNLNEWSPADKVLVKTRAQELLKAGEGSDIDAFSYLSKRPFKGKEAFRKPKIFDDIMTAVEFGYEPVSPNPFDLVRLKLAEINRSAMANRAINKWTSQGDVINVNNSGVPLKKGLREGFNIDEWGKLDDKYGIIWHRNPDTHLLEKIGYRVAKKPVADILNNYLSSSLYNNPHFGQAYKAVMWIGNLLNQFQLGLGSLFHGGFTSIDTQLSTNALVIKDLYGVVRGNRTWTQLGETLKRVPTAMVRTGMEGSKNLVEWRSPSMDTPTNIPVHQLNQTTEGRVAIIAKASELAGMKWEMERGLRTHQSEQLIRDWYGGKRGKAILRSPIALSEASMWPVMVGLVPRQKFGVFGELVGRILEQNPNKTLEELTPALRQAGNRVDARLGQVGYDRLFINNTAKNVIQLLMRAPGWAGGTLSEIGGSVKDAGKFIAEWYETGKAPQDIPDRVAYTMSLLGTMALTNGLLTYLFTGEKPTGMDYWAFRSGGVDDKGRPNRWLLPSYAKEIYSWFNRPAETAVAKLHPLLGLMNDIRRNRTFYGDMIRTEDAGLGRQTLETGEYVLKAFEPFWTRGVRKALEREGEGIFESPQTIAAPLIGIMPAPRFYTGTEATELMDKYYKLQGHKVKTPEEARVAELKSKAVIAGRKGELEKMDKIVTQLEQKHKLTDKQVDELYKKADTPHFAYGFKQIKEFDVALRVWDKATPDEKALAASVMAKKLSNLEKNNPDKYDELEPRLDALWDEIFDAEEKAAQ